MPDYAAELKSRIPELECLIGLDFPYGDNSRTSLATLAYTDADAERMLGDIELELSQARPVGEDYFGNLILMDMEDGSVVFWDVNIVEVFEIAGSLTEFITHLRESAERRGVSNYLSYPIIRRNNVAELIDLAGGEQSLINYVDLYGKLNILELALLLCNVQLAEFAIDKGVATRRSFKWACCGCVAGLRLLIERRSSDMPSKVELRELEADVQRKIEQGQKGLHTKEQLKSYLAVAEELRSL